MASAAAVVDDDEDALIAILDVERDEAVVVAAVPVDEDDDARCSADPSSGADVRDVYSVYLSARDDFSVRG